MLTNEQIATRFEALCGAYVISKKEFRGELSYTVQADQILKIAQTIKDDSEIHFDFLMDVTAVDYIKETPRFEMVYHFFSTRDYHRLRLRARVPESNPEIDSLTALWNSANFMEREVWDMYGIKFRGHPNLKRILLYEEFEGFPLRKDYPMEKEQPLVPLRDVGEVDQFINTAVLTRSS